MSFKRGDNSDDTLITLKVDFTTPEPPGQFQPNLVQSILINIKSHSLFQYLILKLKAKIHRWHFKSFSRIPVPAKLDTKQPLCLSVGSFNFQLEIMIFFLFINVML